MPSVALHSFAIDASERDLVDHDLHHLKVKRQTYLAPVVGDGTAQSVAAVNNTSTLNNSVILVTQMKLKYTQTAIVISLSLIHI